MTGSHPPGTGPGPDERLDVRWLIGLMVANTVAAVGLFGDIVRHVSIIGVLDGDAFLAGWHLVLYGGVLGVALVLSGLAWTEGPLAPVQRLPSATVGLVVLTAGGLGDAAWHGAFGVEAAFPALVSPPHLAVFAGLVALMIAPIGALAREPQPLGLVRSAVVALSITSLMVVISLFTGYLTPLIGGSDLQAGAYIEPLVGTSIYDYDTSRGLAQVLWFAVLTSFTLVVVRTRLAPAPGTWTVAYGVLGLAPLVVIGSASLPITVGLVALGVVADVTGAVRRPHPLATGLATASMWVGFFAVVGARGDLEWLRELWAGAIVSSFLAGLAVAAGIRWIAPPQADRPRPEGEGPPPDRPAAPSA